MAFLCPQCPKRGSLELIGSLELLPAGPWDEVTLQLAACRQCEARVVAFYRESRGGSLQSESRLHRGMRVTPADFEALKRLIAQCPTPRGAGCACAAHAQVRQEAQAGRWRATEDAASADGFAIVLPRR